MNVHGEVTLSGSNVEDGTTGQSISFVIDGNGHPVLRIVDAAPFAYDDTANILAFKSKNVAHTKIETIINAQSVIAGGNTGFIDLGVTNESELWLLVNTDQSTWTLNVGDPTNLSGNLLSTIYPKRQSVATAYPDLGAPCKSLYLGHTVNAAAGLEDLSSFGSAKNYVIPPTPGVSARLTNSSASAAIMTLRVLRVWK